MRCYVTDKQSKWTKWIHLAEYWYNMEYHTTIRLSPFKALYGYDEPSIRDQIITEGRVPGAKKLIEESE